MNENKIGYFPGQTENNNVIGYIEEHIQKFPDRVALRWVSPGALKEWSPSAKNAPPHQEMTYKDFAFRIRKFAQGLLDLGIRQGDRVIIFLPMGLDMYTAMFAVQRIGAIAVFLDSWARANHLGASAECVDPVAMISFSDAFQLVSQVKEFEKMRWRVLWGQETPGFVSFYKLLETNGEAPVAAVKSEDTALITFTTGSSGKPKGANRTHRFLSAQHEALKKVIPYIPEDRDLPAFPIFSLNNLASGVTTLMPALNLAKPSEHDAAILCSQIVNENLSCVTLSPSMLVNVAKYALAENLQLKSLRRVVTGGAPISADDVQSFLWIAPQVELWVLYGSTEVEPMAHIEGRAMLQQKPRSEDLEVLDEGVNVGEISEDLKYKFIKILHGQVDLEKASWSEIEVPQGEVGEFIVTGDHVCRDYYNNPEAFFKTKILDEKGRVWHRTGDLAYVDEQKHLWIVGRVHNVIERAGKYYFPVRAEVLLKRIPGVVGAAYLGLEDPILTQKTVAVIQLLVEGDLVLIKKEIQRVFEKNQIPVDEILVVEEIPMDPRHHSKVEYAVLKERLLDERK